MQKFPPSGIRKWIDFVEYRWNGSTPRRDRWTRRVVTVELAAITVRVASHILTHGRILANKTYNLDNLGQWQIWGADLSERFVDLRGNDAPWEMFFPTEPRRIGLEIVARLKPKMSRKLCKVD